MTTTAIQAELVAAREADAAATRSVLDARTDEELATARAAWTPVRARYNAAKHAAFSHLDA
jgi:hypothetical protein